MHVPFHFGVTITNRQIVILTEKLYNFGKLVHIDPPCIVLLLIVIQ